MEYYGSRRIDELGRMVFPGGLRQTLGIAEGCKASLNPVEHLVVFKCMDDEASPYAFTSDFDNLGRIVIPPELMEKQGWTTKDTKIDIYLTGSILLLKPV
ncbi:MAG: AbrB/MazE/SpoVT family DNA-binding domain-containing protein [Defluviitaleaceae bacterium]|nr:AbrB/MazE/SpoVT family DNA-binding domain-containing protein [Defluviitaleaceae bacterium]